MGELFNKACNFAIKKHSNQVRKDGSMYILHPFEVTLIANSMTQKEEVITAAMLHDTVEDAGVSIEEIKNLFGERVGKLVELETEPNYPNLSKTESWMLRKQGALKKLELINDIDFKILYLSDKLSNIRSLYRDFEKNGDEAFNKFHIKDINMQAWYYYGILDRIEELKEFEAYKEYERKIDYIFKKERKLDNGKNSHSL